MGKNSTHCSKFYLEKPRVTGDGRDSAIDLMNINEPRLYTTKTKPIFRWKFYVGNSMSA